MKKTLLMLTVVCIAFVVHAGNLEPSAAPASTMKTLEQVQPRTPINDTTTPGDSSCIYEITRSGSYYLTGNVAGQSGKSGITVAANNVTLDLCGFTIEGVSGSYYGIRPSGSVSNIVIKNGIVKSFGYGGVSTYYYDYYSPGYMLCTRIEDIIVSDNGGFGIRGGYGGIVRNCIARDNEGHGILTTNNGGVLEGCTAVSNDSNGFGIYEGTTMKNCSSIDNTGVGIYCGNSGHCIIGCNVYSNDGGGIYASGTTVRDCQISSNSTYGVKISFTCMIEGNNISSNSSDGIAGVNISGNGRSRITNNNISSNSGYGISLTNNPGNFIYKNTLRTNTGGDLNVGSSNSAPYSSNPTTAGPWYNIVLTP